MLPSAVHVVVSLLSQLLPTRPRDYSTCVSMLKWCGIANIGDLHLIGEMQIQEESCQLRQLVVTLVTLAVACCQLACQAVSTYHLISRHSGSKCGICCHHELMCCSGGATAIKIGMAFYLESHK